jgi:putative peptidoglycan lipid II flippase
LFAQAVSQLLARAFYAIYDTKTPVTIGIMSIVINTVLSILSVQVLHLPVWSLALSTTIASVFNILALLFYLDKKIGGFDSVALMYAPFKMFLAAFAMGVMLYVPLKLLDQLVFDTTRTVGLLLLTGVAGSIGMLTYLFLSWVLAVDQVGVFLHFITKLTKKMPYIFEPAQEAVNSELREL